MESIRQTQVQPVLLSKIHPNPNQPRHVITPEMVDAMAASLKASGLKNPVKLRPLPDGQFEVISGHIRTAAARKLDWETIPALVLDLTPEQALLESILDNRGQPMSWLDECLAIESVLSLKPGLTQRDLADLLEMSLGSINRGLKLAKFLNEVSRGILVQNLNKSGQWQVTENAVFRLTDLKGPETVEKALQVVLDRQMTELQAAKLVNWVLQTGQDPASYPLSIEKKGGEAEVDLSDPNASYWKPLPSYIRIRKTPQGYRVGMDLTLAQGPLAVYGAMAWMENAKAQTGEGTPDLQYNNAWPQLVEGAKKQLEEESRLQAEQDEQARVQSEQKAKAKAEALAQKHAVSKAKVEAKNAAAALKEHHRVMAEKQAQVALEDLRGLVKAHVESNLGAGTLADMVLKAALGGQKSKALKLYADGLAHLGKTEEEQKPILGMFEGLLGQLKDLKKQQGTVTTPSPEKPFDNAQGRPAVRDGEAGIEPPGVLGQVVEAAKEKLDLTPQGITDALVNDAKKAVNYEIRKGMRDVLKDVL